MYFRLYPSKNNTIFRYKSINSDGSTRFGSDDINTGANPVMELQDGRGESKLMFAFDIPDWLKTRLQAHTYTAKLQLWDAGTLFQPPIKLKQVSLTSFTDDFAEGDGYSFTKPENLVGISNWKYRLDGQLWSAVTFTPVTTYNLNTFNEDLNFTITSSIQSFLSGGNQPKYALSITTPEMAELIHTKFIHSNYTKTLFKPYIEFFINDEITDKSLNCTAGVANKIYLINESGADVVGTLSAIVTHESGSPITLTVVKERTGVYVATITPPVPSTMKPTYSKLVWSINSIPVKQQMITVISPNRFEAELNYQNLFFYPATPHTHNIVRQGDIVPFQVVSQIRGKGDVTMDTYEYRVTSADGFEMIPWSKVSVYRERMYFNINTEFFFAEQQYEIWLRNKMADFTLTSHQTHKFKVAMNDKSHMRALSTSPYYSREVYFGK